MSLYQNPANFNQFSILNWIGSFINLNPDLIWFAVGLLGVFFTVASIILSYHWKKFGSETLVMAKASLLYFSVSAVLLVTIVISLVVYLNSL